MQARGRRLGLRRGPVWMVGRHVSLQVWRAGRVLRPPWRVLISLFEGAVVARAPWKGLGCSSPRPLPPDTGDTTPG